MNLSENIARLRKERGMTQEALAEVIGVSAQTISKWENATTYPDVALLPVIADVFGVTIDALYGRESAGKEIHPDEALEAVVEQVRRIIVRCFYYGDDKAKIDDLVEDHKASLKGGVMRSVIQNYHGGVIYMREPLGAVAIKRPADGWSSLFVNEGNRRIMLLLADDDFRKAMAVILRKRVLTFTLPGLCRMADVEDAVHLEQLVKDSGLFACKSLTVDESTLTYYELTQAEQKMYLLLAALLFAQEYADYRNQHCYFRGAMDYFTP